MIAFKHSVIGRFQKILVFSKTDGEFKMWCTHMISNRCLQWAEGDGSHHTVDIDSAWLVLKAKESDKRTSYLTIRKCRKNANNRLSAFLTSIYRSSESGFFPCHGWPQELMSLLIDVLDLLKSRFTILVNFISHNLWFWEIPEPSAH